MSVNAGKPLRYLAHSSGTHPGGRPRTLALVPDFIEVPPPPLPMSRETRRTGKVVGGGARATFESPLGGGGSWGGQVPPPCPRPPGPTRWRPSPEGSALYSDLLPSTKWDPTLRTLRSGGGDPHPCARTLMGLQVPGNLPPRRGAGRVRDAITGPRGRGGEAPSARFEALRAKGERRWSPLLGTPDLNRRLPPGPLRSLPEQRGGPTTGAPLVCLRNVRANPPAALRRLPAEIGPLEIPPWEGVAGGSP